MNQNEIYLVWPAKQNSAASSRVYRAPPPPGLNKIGIKMFLRVSPFRKIMPPRGILGWTTSFALNKMATPKFIEKSTNPGAHRTYHTALDPCL